MSGTRSPVKYITRGREGVRDREQPGPSENQATILSDSPKNSPKETEITRCGKLTPATPMPPPHQSANFQVPY